MMNPMMMMRMNMMVQSATRLEHGDRLMVSAESFISICIHHGTNTCNKCEPGIVQAEFGPEQKRMPSSVHPRLPS